jgi:hypothetical protein
MKVTTAEAHCHLTGSASNDADEKDAGDDDRSLPVVRVKRWKSTRKYELIC